ncbi:glia maturation factor gamma-like [Salvelinus fontinalis]|uniref:glia maturation factor gamma-like n=1 Tax=Salvelinus fontinalis TaxID=8038 RepID=UPI002484F1CC|nr:glia maturation factor gamma-like [Salvelinus fontinalis]
MAFGRVQKGVLVDALVFVNACPSLLYVLQHKRRILRVRQHPVTSSWPRRNYLNNTTVSLQTRTQNKTSSRMSSSLVVCEVDESLKEKLKKFRFRKETNNAAILMKIDMEKQLVILEEEYEDISLDDLRNELPERQPRFIVYSYKYIHTDGRVSYPLCFIFSSPVGCKPEQQMMYAGSKNQLVSVAELTKVFETRNIDDLSEEWLINKLSFFR